MRIRIFQVGAQGSDPMSEFEGEGLPAVGDLLSVEYGDSVRSLLRVRERKFRVYGVLRQLVCVDLEAEPAEPDATPLSRRP